MKKLLMVLAISTLPLMASPSASANPLMHAMFASWYGPGFDGRKMANGKVFRQSDPSVAAHKSLPFGTRLEITNPANGKTLTAIVQDRGPYIKGRQLDLSLAGAQALGFVASGIAKLRVKIVPRGR